MAVPMECTYTGCEQDAKVELILVPGLSSRSTQQPEVRVPVCAEHLGDFILRVTEQ